MTIFDSHEIECRQWKRVGQAPDFFSVQVAEARRFYLNLAPSRRVPLAVVCGGREHCIADYVIQRATFPYYSIEFVAQGRGTVTLQGEKHRLRSGTLFCYGPGIRQEIATDPTDPLVKYFVDFAGLDAVSVLAMGGLKPGQTLQILAPGDLQTVFEELIHNGLRATRYSAAICTKLLECLALKVAELSAPTEGLESPAFLTYRKCHQHIQQHFERLRTLDQIARECHVNDAYLCRLFRRFDHQTPYQFLVRLRMNLAAERLREPGALIKQVAERSGFSDPFHFSRAFKSIFGVSPDAFRKLH